MRLGLFGGSFDPVHLGHLQLAKSCQEQANLDEVWFLPAATQPLKRGGPVATDKQRCEMLELAITGQPSWKVSRIEIDRGGLSYTVDTLREVQAANPDAKLFFLMGADSLRDFPKWREPAEILNLAIPLVVARAGEPPPLFESLEGLSSPEHLRETAAARVEMPPMSISSSEVRARLVRGESVDEFVSPAVAEYLRKNNVYTPE